MSTTTKVELSVPVAVISSMTDAQKRYALTIHGHVTCSCPAAAHPSPGHLYGKCKHTEQYEGRMLTRTIERQTIIDGIHRLQDQLRAFDGGDNGNPWTLPIGANEEACS